MSGIAREDGHRLFGTDPAGYDAARPGHADRVYEVLAELDSVAAVVDGFGDSIEWPLRTSLFTGQRPTG